MNLFFIWPVPILSQHSLVTSSKRALKRRASMPALIAHIIVMYESLYKFTAYLGRLQLAILFDKSTRGLSHD